MRAKIILPNFTAVLILGLASFFFLRHNLEKKAENSIRSRLDTVSALFPRSEAWRGYELLSDVNRAAMSKDIRKAFERVDVARQEGASQDELDAEVRRVWFGKCVRAIHKYLEKTRGSKPDLVVLTDRAGVAVARNITPNACPAGYSLVQGMSVVKRALDGEPAYSVWSVEDSLFRSKNPDAEHCQLMNAGLMELAAAPIWLEDNIVGTIVLGFELSNGTAKKHAQLLDTDVALVKSGDVYSSSFETDTARSSLERRLDLPDVKQKLTETLNSGRRSEFFEISVEGEPYLAAALPLAGAALEDNIVILLMASKKEAMRGLRSLGVILVFTGICLIVVFGVGMVLSTHFLKPVMGIEEGILKVINGDFSYRFDIKSSEVGGLAYRINQMISVLTGEDDDPSEEESSTEE